MKTVIVPCRPFFAGLVVLLVLVLDEEGAGAFWAWSGGELVDARVGRA